MRLQVNRGSVLLFFLCVIFSLFCQNTPNDSVVENIKINDNVVIDSLSTINSQAPEVITELNNSQNEYSILDFSINVLLFIFGIIFGILLVYFYTKKHIYSILNDEKSENIDHLNKRNEKYLFKYIGLVKILYLSKEKYKKKYNDLQYKGSETNNNSNGKQTKSQYSISQLNLEKASTESTMVYNENLHVEEENIPNNVIEWKVDQGTKQTNILYFSIPEADGSFKVVNAKTVKEIDCFYKIEIDKNNQKGKLFFISSEFDSRALDNIDYYLNPVCEIENISDRTHAKKINVIDFGTVVLNGDTWKIESNKKLKIRLI